MGDSALKSNTTGEGNTALGETALKNNIDGNYNTAIGRAALASNTADHNTAIGDNALLSNTSGVANTAIGSEPLVNNLEGSYNVAIGNGALVINSNGNNNTGIGASSLAANVSGSNNTAIGNGALFTSFSGDNNTAIGFRALQANSFGALNTANGFKALFSNNSGGSNTAEGDLALYNNTSGSSNVAVGTSAGFNATTGNNNVYIGGGMLGVAGESDSCYIASIYQRPSGPNSLPVAIGDNGKLGAVASSRRFKREIKPMDRSSEAILALKPVMFRYKKEIDPVGTSQFGLVAEDVEKVNHVTDGCETPGCLTGCLGESVLWRTRKPVLLFARGFDDLSEAARVKTGTANQCAVDVGLGHEFAGILRFHAAAVLDPDSLGCGLIGHLAQSVANERVRFLCLLGCCVAPGTDRPHWLVRDHRFLQLLWTQTGETAAQLDRQNLFHVALVALLERFSDANNRTQCRRMRCAHFTIDDFVGLTKQRTAFAVPEHDVVHKQVAQKRSTDLAGKRPVVFPIHVLRADLDVLCVT